MASRDPAGGITRMTIGEYYQQRAPEYDEVYAKPERQADLAELRRLLPPLVAGRRVLEIAAGTTIHLFCAAAGTDPRAYGDPGFDITATGRPPHFGFGGGIHYCLGHLVARTGAG